MFHLLIDTSVWLDLAADQKQTPLLAVVEQLMRDGKAGLMVPRIVLDEFRRNRERIAKTSAKSLSTHFQAVRDAVTRAGGDQRKSSRVLDYLADVNHKIPLIGGAAAQTLDRIEKLLASADLFDASPGAMLRAAERAILGRAPFHRGRNSMADAVLMEAYIERTHGKQANGHRFAFVTHNKTDFSAADGNQRVPHPDWGASAFSRIKSLYFINLAEALRRVDPDVVSEVLFEQTWTEEPRGLAELLKAEDLLFHQVWYNRHWNTRIAIRRGEIKLVDEADYDRTKYNPKVMLRSVWQMAMKAAKNAERKYGKKNLGPWDDFEWGMINGKLSAIRWALGSEWDFLDT